MGMSYHSSQEVLENVEPGKMQLCHSLHRDQP
jgi:hypothetical protein